MREDLKNKIREWPDKQGYPLEMTVARAFQEAGFYVSSSEYYLDADEKKPREIDVIASQGGAHAVPGQQAHVVPIEPNHLALG
ncbi:MAG: hypothetical protein ABSF90_25990 [Syntrophobacteraceae bacterium]|jgi:predicted RecB family endonuclease